MENNIKTFVTDITFMSELTPTVLLRKAKQWGLIRPASCILQECSRAH